MIKVPDKLKKILKSKGFGIALYTVLLLFLVYWILYTLEFSYNFTGIRPQNIKAENGVYDFSGIDLETAEGGKRLRGDWQFYYNKWIVTDNLITDEPDGLIYVPSRWTGMRFNGAALSREGFASYALVMQNVGKGQKLEIHETGCDTPYRIFANGVLITTYGIMSKDKSETRISYEPENVNTYITTKTEDVLIVVEVGNAGLGGLNDCPVVAMQGSGIKFARSYFNKNFPLFFAGIAISFTIINLIMVFSLFGEKKEWTTVAFLIAVFLHYLFSKNIYFILNRFTGPTPPILFYILNIFSNCFMLLSFLFHLQREKVTDFSKRSRNILAALISALFLVYYLMTGSFWQVIPFVLLLAVMAVILYRILRSMQKGVRFSFIYSFFMMLSMVVFIYEGMDFWSAMIFSSSEPPWMLVTTISIMMSIIYFVRMRQNTVGAMKSIQLEKDYTDMRHAAMLAQIKPHFVFNALTSIQSMYHESLEEGDTALNYFSKHLRSNIESDKRDLIPFEDELLNIGNYFELENMRLKNKVRLLFDIEYFDFDVPILSLQPLIENAIKYAKTELIEDGYIQIVSRLEEKRIVIEVNDNGIGFDAAAIKPESKGLANIIERFKYSLNAEIVIDSEIGKGTAISIFIPYAEKTAEIDE